MSGSGGWIAAGVAVLVLGGGGILGHTLSSNPTAANSPERLAVAGGLGFGVAKAVPELAKGGAAAVKARATNPKTKICSDGWGGLVRVPAADPCPPPARNRPATAPAPVTAAHSSAGSPGNGQAGGSEGNSDARRNSGPDLPGLGDFLPSIPFFAPVVPVFG